MEITHLDKNVLFGAFAKACSNLDGGIVGGGNCFADDLGIGCPFESDNEEMSCSSVKPAHWREVFEGEDKPKEKKTDSWKVGDIVEVKNERDGKWYPGKILLIDKTSAPFFVQSEFGFKEVSKLTRCLWCSEGQLRRLEEPEPEPEFKFGDKVRVDGMRAVFARYSDTSHKTAYILFESGSLLPERRVATIKAGWE